MDASAELESALALHRAGERDKAATGYRRIIDAAQILGETNQTEVTEATHLLGVLALQQGNPGKAAELIGQAISRNEHDARYHNNLGNAQLALGRTEAALASFWRAGELNPDLFDAHFNRATALLQTHRPSEATDVFRRALELQPKNADAWCNLGSALRAQPQLLAAREAFEEAVRWRPGFAAAHANLGAVWRELGNLSRAEASLREALRHDSKLGEAHINLGDLFVEAHDYGRAIAAYTETLEHKPALATARTKLIATRLMLCDWSNLDALRNRFKKLDAGALSASLPGSNGPFASLMLGLPAHSQRDLADCWAAEIGRRTVAYPRRESAALSARDILRVGYLSDDFRDHPVGHIMHGLFALHDPNQVTVHVYSTGHDDGSVYRQSAERDSDQFRDIAQASHAEVADLIRTDGIDILVNLQGHTAGARGKIVAQHPAPVQVSWLGYPATMGGSLMDYLICDPVAAPLESDTCFAETLVMLPHCYIPGYADIEPTSSETSRDDQGLPDGVPVFCCFNASYKIDPTIFERWMKILLRVPNAVLWLRGGQAEAALKEAAKLAGVDAGRLVFTQGRIERAAHIARHRLADLFLDTHHYSAHATALDALTAGLSILTCPGPSLAGRATASMLTTLGLEDLIAANLETYEDKAVQLAADRFTGLKTRLAEASRTSHFHDREQFVQHLEAAFRMMAGQAQSGQPRSRIEVSL